MIFVEFVLNKSEKRVDNEPSLLSVVEVAAFESTFDLFNLTDLTMVMIGGEIEADLGY